MEGSSKEWKKFDERDRVAAENFAEAVNEVGVSRVIYLGGLTLCTGPRIIQAYAK